MAATGINIGGALGASTPLRRLLTHADEIGAIYRLDGYREALVVTHDAFVAEAVGLPQHAFLLACLRTVRDGDVSELPEVDREVVLLRVMNTTPLPDDGQMDRLRAELAHEATYEHTRPPERRRSEQQLIDPITANKAATFGVRCAVLGTFYDDRDRPKDLLFGSDLDTINASRRLMVYKPHSDSLRELVSFIAQDAGGGAQQRMMVHLGDLRYASTRRRESSAGDGRKLAVPVEVDIADFVAHKTAIFGMTRLGKSNTMKVLAASVFRYAMETGTTIGQLIFDPAGEYAEENQQDRTSLAAISTSHVVRYRFGANEQDVQAGLKPLALNLFDHRVVDAARELVASHVLALNQSQYAKDFASSDIADPPGSGAKDGEHFRALAHAQRARGLFYAALLRAGLKPASGWTYRLPLKKELLVELAQLDHPDDASRSPRHFLDAAPKSGRGMVELDAQQLLAVCETIAEATRTEPPSVACHEWLASEDGRHQAIAKMLRGWDGVGGWKLLLDLRHGYHSAAARSDYQNEVYDDLVAGKVVIVDLARGEASVQRFASERIITYLLASAAQRFRQGEHAHHIQVFLEEAHILFNRDKAQKEGTRDPYVRLAREAGKYKIGMIYATQQVSSVSPDILDNTANWVVAHLNSENEVKHLRGRYEFDRFAEQIKTAEDKGFVRVKTLSSRYVIPVQVRLFDIEMVKQAQLAEARSGQNNGQLL